VPGSKLEFSRGDTIAEKYEVIDLLDESPLGLTYRVRHSGTGKFVRLTMLRPKIANKQHKQELLDAYRLARSFDHPNLMKVGELGEQTGVAYYTAEDFEGITLRDLLAQYKVEGKRFSVKEAAQITKQVLEALQAIHDAGAVARAIRPEYVLVNVRHTGPRKSNLVARVKVIGAGIWNLVPIGTLAEDEFTRGEAQYLAPELKSFEPTPTARCDVYSTGVIFYEMLTGTAPVGTFQLPSTLRSDLPKRVDDVVELVLANAPEDRYQTTRDFHNDIQRLFDEGLADTDEAGRSLAVPALVLGLGLVVVAAVAVALLLWPDDPMKREQARMTELRNEVASAHPKPSEDDIQAVLARHPPNMVYVPAGSFIRGRMYWDPEAGAGEPLSEVVELDGYLIDAFEAPDVGGRRPTTQVTWNAASEACEASGKRLCSADEWEKACKGPLNFVHSYGDTYDPEFCGEGLESPPYASGQMPSCKSGWGVYDASGNHREWTADSPSGKESRGVVKGGLRNKPSKGTRCAFSSDESKSYADASLSFRCCRDLEAAPYEAPKPAPADE
jgi:serine/threonine protein kinase